MNVGLLARILLFAGMMVGVLIIPFGLPGAAVVFLSALIYAFASGFESSLSPGFLAILGILMILAETADNWLMAMGAKRFGASPRSIGLALMGGFVGGLLIGPLLAIVLNVLGPVVGAFLGAFIAVVVYERRQSRDWREALRAGWGTLIGRVAGIAMKMAIGIAMASAIAWKVLVN